MEVLSGLIFLRSFGWAFAASLAIEVIQLYRLFDSDKPIPRHYKKVSFWIVRCLVAVIGGGIAVAYGTCDNLLAVSIGAATPRVIQLLGKAGNMGLESVASAHLGG